MLSERFMTKIRVKVSGPLTQSLVVLQRLPVYRLLTVSAIILGIKKGDTV